MIAESTKMVDTNSTSTQVYKENVIFISIRTRSALRLKKTTGQLISELPSIPQKAEQLSTIKHTSLRTEFALVL